MIYDFQDKEKLIVVGDIHGDFKELMEIGNTLRSDRYSNAVIVALGDIGLGFHKDSFYEPIFQRINETFQAINSICVLFRGNHDDPSYFDGKRVKHSNLIAIPDYSLIKTQHLSTLVVGGGLSVDRTWRKQEEYKRNRFKYVKSKHLVKFYWPDEMPQFKPDEIDKFLDAGEYIDSVLTHTAPTFVHPLEKETSLGWLEVDENLKDDIQTERGTMDQIYHYLQEKGQHLKIWAYGHFHCDYVMEYEGVIFNCVNIGHKEWLNQMLGVEPNESKKPMIIDIPDFIDSPLPFEAAGGEPF